MRELHARDSQRRSGLTLIELVVVLTILVALGGLIVPMLPNFLAKTHFAKCSTTIPEINKLWITSYTGDVKYPNGYDSLLEGGGLFSQLPGADAGGEVLQGTLTADQAANLVAIGVSHVYDHTAVTVPDSATLDSVPNDPSVNFATARQLADGEAVAVINPAGPSVESLGIDVAKYQARLGADVQFVVFGIGNNCDAVGPTGLMTEAPTHFGGEDAMNPVDFYQRYCVIFATSDEKAEFVCACSIHPDGFDGAEAHIRAYYEDQQI
ncbi:type II secretion system protein [Roseiconus lacunae]|nr:type II secretion system protein [Roseiconus lacunae]WRQ53206.1 type II secretion system protein [Stieleria sp. HD01]